MILMLQRRLRMLVLGMIRLLSLQLEMDELRWGIGCIQRSVGNRKVLSECRRKFALQRIVRR